MVLHGLLENGLIYCLFSFLKEVIILIKRLLLEFDTYNFYQYLFPSTLLPFQYNTSFSIVILLLALYFFQHHTSFLAPHYFQHHTSFSTLLLLLHHTFLAPYILLLVYTMFLIVLYLFSTIFPLAPLYYISHHTSLAPYFFFSTALLLVPYRLQHYTF